MTTPRLTLAQAIVPATPAQWNASILANCDILGLSTTGWEQGAPTRTEVAAVANILASSDVAASIFWQGGFLTYAANGSVTWVDQTGATQTAYVTPDPSIPAQNPTGAAGLLDILASSLYNVQRTFATAASGTLNIFYDPGVSTTPYTFSAGTYHVTVPSSTSGITWSNSASITISNSTPIVSSAITAVGNTAPIQITCTGHGLVTGSVVGIGGVKSGSNLLAAVNGIWIVTYVDGNNFTLNGSSSWVGSAYPGTGGVVYTPSTIAIVSDPLPSGQQAGIQGNVSSTGTSGITKAVTTLPGVYVVNSSAISGGVACQSNQALVANCINKLAFLSSSGPSSAYVYVAENIPTLTTQYAALWNGSPPGYGGPLYSNAISARQDTDITTGITFTTFWYGTSSAPSGTDITNLQSILQTLVVPIGELAACRAASLVPIAVTVTAWLPSQYRNTTTQGVIQSAVVAWFPTLPIGGEVESGNQVVPINAMIEYVYAALLAYGIPQTTLDTSDIQATLGGSGSNYVLPTYLHAAYCNGTPTVSWGA